MESNQKENIIEEVTKKDYEFGFVTDIETDFIPKGLNEDIVRMISKKKEEPEWLLEFRLKAFRHWLTLKQPTWAHLDIPPIDYQSIIYYAAPKKRQEKQSLDEVDPELLATFDKLGISLDEQKKLSGVAVDAVMDSTSVKTTFQETLTKHGIIFMSFSEAVKQHPDLVKKYLGEEENSDKNSEENSDNKSVENTPVSPHRHPLDEKSTVSMSASTRGAAHSTMTASERINKHE